MFAAAWKTTKPALFPLVMVNPDGTFIPAGSAFFVDADGTFITCAHTLKPSPPRPYQYIGRPGEAAQHPFLPITILHRDEATDVAVGRVLGMRGAAALKLAEKAAPAGSSVAICGYPIFQDQNGSNASMIARFQPTFVLDRAVAQRAGRPWRGMLMRDNPFFGMSGGPVVDVDGLVVGVQSAVERARFNRSAGREFKVENGLATDIGDLHAALAVIAGMSVVSDTGAA